MMAGVAPGENLAQSSRIYEGAGETGFLDVSENTSAAISAISRSDQLLSYGISIALLIYSLMVARGMAIKGSSLAEGALSRIKAGGVKLGKLAALGVAGGGIGAPLAAVGYKGLQKTGLTEFAGKYVRGKTKQVLHDVSTAKGIEGGLMRRGLKYLTKEGREGFLKRGEQKRRWAAEKAAGAGREDSDVFFTGGWKPWRWGREGGAGVRGMAYQEIAEHKIEQEQVKEFSSFGKDRFMKFAENAEKVEGVDGDRLRRSVVLSAANKGYLDDLMSQDTFRERYQKLGEEKYGYRDGTFYNDVLLNEFLYDYLGGKKTAGEGKVDASQDTMRVLDELEDIGRSTNHWEYVGHSNFNTTTGRYGKGDFQAVGNERNLAIDVDGSEIEIEGAKIRADTVAYNYSTKSWQAKTESDQDVALQRQDLDRFRWVNHKMQDFSVGEMQKLGSRDKAKAAPHNFVSLRFDEGTGKVRLEGAMTEFHRTALNALGGEVAREVQHTQARLKEWFFGTKQLSAGGAVETDSERNIEKIEALYAQNPTIMKSLFKLLANNDNWNQGFAVEKKDESGNVTEELIFGDEGHVRRMQKERLEDFMSASVPEVREYEGHGSRAAASGDEQGVQKAAQGVAGLVGRFAEQIFRYVKVDNRGRYTPEKADEQIAKMQILHDGGQVDSVFEKDGRVKDREAFQRVLQGAFSQQLQARLAGDLRLLEQRLGKVGTGGAGGITAGATEAPAPPPAPPGAPPSSAFAGGGAPIVTPGSPEARETEERLRTRGAQTTEESYRT